MKDFSQFLCALYGSTSVSELVELLKLSRANHGLQLVFTYFSAHTLPGFNLIVLLFFRNELENAFAGDYMEPDTLKKQIQQQKRPPRLSDVSLDDLKAVMREELDRFRSQTGLKSPAVSFSSEDAFESPGIRPYVEKMTPDLEVSRSDTC